MPIQSPIQNFTVFGPITPMACKWRMICHQIAPKIVLFKPVILLIYTSTTLNMVLCNNFALLHGTPVLNRINVFTNLIHVCGVWSSYNAHLENSLRESSFFVILSTGGTPLLTAVCVIFVCTVCQLVPNVTMSPLIIAEWL